MPGYVWFALGCATATAAGIAGFYWWAWTLWRDS